MFATIIRTALFLKETVLVKSKDWDGRKFLDRFKSYFGSQISSQSLNEVHIYRLQPKSATKGDFFLIYFGLWLYPGTCCAWQTMLHLNSATTSRLTNTMTNFSLEDCLLITDTNASLSVCSTTTEFFILYPQVSNANSMGISSNSVMFCSDHHEGQVCAKRLGQETSQRETCFSHYRYSESSTRHVGPVWLLL